MSTRFTFKKERNRKLTSLSKTINSFNKQTKLHYRLFDQKKKHVNVKKEKSSWFSKDCRTGKKILVISNKGLSDTSKQELEHSGTLVTETTNTAANKKKKSTGKDIHKYTGTL